ncbi:MAG TPA: oligosaccharide repeat unit polymerase [Candidatus Acidoferrum sp.]|nr:oligosaccharide repeat unit polymerase [Candidatus Acidoferrum sp.]
MFEALIWITLAIAAIGVWWAYDGSRDVFHPLIFIGPMLGFVYGWMPIKLYSRHGLEPFFREDQLIFVQTLNAIGVLCFVLGCLSVSPRSARRQKTEWVLSWSGTRTLVTGGVMLGLIGLVAWAVSIINVGGFYNAFSKPYSGGWDDNGYVRDASMLMFPAFILIATAALRSSLRPFHIVFLVLFIVPWVIQAFFTARRGPTTIIVIVVSMSYYLNRNKRPPIIATALGGLALGCLLLFLVTNRGKLYLGSDFDVSTDVSRMVEAPDAGNEYIYGTGALLSAEQRQSFYWGRRYLAQILVRPIPSAIWPTKYVDCGLPELGYNAGTGEGFAETLGWQGANGSAPGLIADLWLEVRWLALPLLILFGRIYGVIWKRAVTEGQAWIAQYIVISALSIYLVMQTMEAVIFRFLILSIPIWSIWGRAMNKPEPSPGLQPVQEY